MFNPLKPHAQFLDFHPPEDAFVLSSSRPPWSAGTPGDRQDPREDGSGSENLDRLQENRPGETVSEDVDSPPTMKTFNLFFGLPLLQPALP